MAHAPSTPVEAGPRRGLPSLFLLSLLTLFLELAFIRWVGTEIRIFAYLQNTVLVVCFLGIGVGCLTAARGFRVRDVVWPVLAFQLLMAAPPTRSALAWVSALLSVSEDLVIWNQGLRSTPLPTACYLVAGLFLTFIVMLLVFDAFVPLGRLLGSMMSGLPRTIRAYSVNVAGSLAGVWLFTLLSAGYAPPVVWFALAGVLMLWFADGDRRTRLGTVALVAAMVGLTWFASRERAALEALWSPYQKLVLKPTEAEAANHIGAIGSYAISVNNVDYQEILDGRVGLASADAAHYPPDQRGFSQYDLPARFHPEPRRMLIVGAGSGNDVAGALRNGVERVVAVEIDPAIIALGERYHPEQPYRSPRVRVVNDDARSFFATTPERYDVVSFGLLDSHTTTAMTNARLDHYVYTAESFARAKQLLADGGVMVLNFYASRPFIADRIAASLRAVFGKPPLVFRIPANGWGRGGVMFVIAPGDVVEQRLAAEPALRTLVERWSAAVRGLSYTTRIATDDWPYLYLERPGVPLLYLHLAGLLVLLLVVRRRRLGLTFGVFRWSRTEWHFFFMGAAFLLLEVQNVSKAAVALGNTWVVNAVIISGILVMVLLANLAAARWPRLPLGLVYGLLFASCVALYGFDLAALAGLPYGLKAALVGAVTAAPMFFSGIVFIHSFARAPRKDLALGANLFGSLIGGLLQTVTFVVGVQTLLLIVAAFYALAMLTRPGGPTLAWRRRLALRAT